MNTQLNELRRLLAEIDSLAGSVEVSGFIREARAFAEKARSRTAKAIKLVAELDTQAGPIPEGFALVPLEPTTEMREAFHNSYELYEDGVDECPDDQWKAMIAAALAPGGYVNGS
ncbi:hypothetical protein [Pseudomonas nitroreducens]|uniref:Uncharacterized protein n=1 Tax=Pseudomonas nitroreducens TaxID=46680 RepID=A0A2D0ADT7_PSENT|nr:hypothetical protein [Pseudomonas nitroreducens]OWP50244.1 hypothetical protein CEG18_11845 [Pseudomonas nitroreducens]